LDRAGKTVGAIDAHRPCVSQKILSGIPDCPVQYSGIPLGYRKTDKRTGEYSGCEGTCLGRGHDRKWAVSPDSSNVILQIEFDAEFGLLIDLASNPQNN